MGGKAVAEGVRADPFGDSRRPGCSAHGFLQAAFVSMVAADDPATRVYRKSISRKNILPDPPCSALGYLRSRA
jgi:hypothetical protein